MVIEKSEVGLNSTTEILGTNFRKAAYLKLACACKHDYDGPVDVRIVEELQLPESEGELIRSVRSKASFKTSLSSSMVGEY